jgi:hypothetical protein
MAPIKDPLEEVPLIGPIDAADTRERLLFQFLRDAPFLPNGKFLAKETATVRLWPHQQATVDDIVSRYPARYLLCSEVGPGKTIEAGIALRQLVLAGKVKRCLILTPKSVGRQWQEELYEKMNLNIPLFSENAFTDYFRNVVDEAHHARRKDFLDDRRRPNRLLELLEGTAKLPGLASKTKGLMFLTATPMQVHPVEVWDLLKSLDLGGRWEASDENFLRDELRRPFERVD